MKDMILGMAKRSLLFGCMLGSVTAAVQAQTDGIFAEFSTSMGSFTCRVDYAKSPKASANFIGLATGQRSWLDPVTGVVMAKPYFGGQIFHRVVAGFVIQSGSPDGSPSGGPGYTFQDEFDPDLRHDAFGVLSMANSGADANGSQFFITVAARPDLDDRYTIFGRVVGGSNAVQAINGVETDSSDRPLTNVVLESVRIRRVGSAAQSFDIQAQGLPFVSGLEATLAKTSTNVVLSYSNGLGQDTRLYTSPNLANWTGSKLGIETTPPVFTGVCVNMMAPQRFYRMAKINYPASLSVPESVANLTLTLSFSAYFGTIWSMTTILHFSAN